MSDSSYLYGGYLNYLAEMREHNQLPKHKLERGAFAARNLEGVKTMGHGRGFTHAGGVEHTQARPFIPGALRQRMLDIPGAKRKEMLELPGVKSEK